jgi:hypothetical protein
MGQQQAELERVREELERVRLDADRWRYLPEDFVRWNGGKQHRRRNF